MFQPHSCNSTGINKPNIADTKDEDRGKDVRAATDDYSLFGSTATNDKFPIRQARRGDAGDEGIGTCRTGASHFRSGWAEVL